MKISVSVSLFALAIGILLSCNKSPTSSTPSAGSSSPVKFGDEELRDLSPLPADYRPEGLSLKIFTRGQSVFVPMDFQYQNLHMDFDAQETKFQGHSVIQFKVPATGHPYFQLEGSVQAARLNGQAVSLQKISDPDGMSNSYWALETQLSEQTLAILELQYTVPVSRFDFKEGAVSFLSDMSDLLPAHYFENWAPVGFEEDAFALALDIQIRNSKVQHRLFSNGAVARLSPFQWQITFPSYFTPSSFYVHLTARPLTSIEFSIQGLEKDISVTVYSSDASLTQKARQALPALFAELERDFGPYAHARFTAYLHSGSGGMEYSGATITSLSALGHELFHSWFARGVMPADGRSGWIDEAMASWRDYGYFQTPALLSRTATQLAVFSPYRKSTPANCYRDGRKLLAELDVLLSPSGGMKTLMRHFYQRYRYRVVTTEEFQNFLKMKTDASVELFFDRYVFGRSGPSLSSQEATDSITNEDKTLHPARLTEEEARSLR